ncbi:hypothetical protein HWV62_9485 [Athelia sp. TMB]|nr:hypothetical protein HWV62_9485 [Athelia sp. TMB]
MDHLQICRGSSPMSQSSSAPSEPHSDNILLKSADDGYLPASRTLLSLASPTLKDKLALPAKEWKHNLPVTQLLYRYRTLWQLISLSSPKWEPDPAFYSLADFDEVLKAAKSYGMIGVMQVAESIFQKSPLLAQDAVGAFALAKYFELDEPLITAARHILSRSPMNQIYQAELDKITAGDYARLKRFYTASSGQRMLPRQWWCDYLDRVHSAFSQCPNPDILLQAASVDYASDKSPTSQPATAVLPMFNDENADMIVRSSDGVCFHVHAFIMSLCVPIFETMSTLPQVPAASTTVASASTSFVPPVVDVSEASETVQQFLQLCYPTIANPNVDSLECVQALLEMATKYDTDAIKERVAKFLEIFISHHALRVYAIAYRYQLEKQRLRTIDCTGTTCAANLRRLSDSQKLAGHGYIPESPPSKPGHSGWEANIGLQP